MPLAIRAASPDDVSALASLLGELGYPSQANRIGERMRRVLGPEGDSQTDAVFVSTEERGGIVGLLSLHQFAVLHDDAPVALITALVVAERARGLGVGRELVERAIDTARRWGCTRLLVTTHVRRAGAHAFYERIGFEHTGRRYVRAL